MRKYKVWFHVAFAVAAAVLSVVGVAVLGFWFGRVYAGSADVLGERGGLLFVLYGAFVSVQILIYGAALIIGLSIARVHLISRTLFRYWVGISAAVLLLFLLVFGDYGFQAVLLVSYPFLSLVTAACSLITLRRSSKRLGLSEQRK